MPSRAEADAQKKTRHAAEQERVDVAAARKAWRDTQPGLRSHRLVFLDETWASTNMGRPYGRAPRGKRLVAAVPHGHWKTTTLIAAVRHDGITAPCVLDGPIDGESFRAYIEQMLTPVLTEGDIVIMDNLASHKVRGIREMIEATGAELVYLPPYSPDFNPIENLFAKIKALLAQTRRAQRRRALDSRGRRDPIRHPRRLCKLLRTRRVSLSGMRSRLDTLLLPSNVGDRAIEPWIELKSG